MSTPQADHDISARLRLLAETVPDRIAVVGPDESVTFAQLYRRATDQAEDLALRHPRPRRSIIVLPARSSSAFLTSLVATWIAGHTPLPVPPRSAEQIKTKVQEVDDPQCQPWKATIRVHQGHPDVLVTHGESPTNPRKGEALGMRRSGSAMIASPLHYNGPFEFAVRQLLLGGTLILAAPFACDTWLRAAVLHRPLWAFLVPTQVRRLIAHAGLPALADATRSLTRLVISSQPLPAPLASAMASAFGAGRVAQYYGTADYDGSLVALVPQPTQVGAQPISGAELRIVNQNGTPVHPGERGFIQGRSQVGLITHRLSDPCPPADAWHTVGDQGRLGRDGSLELVSVAVAGRAIVGGVKVALDHVRDVVESHDDVAGCLVQADPDPDYGQVVSIRVTARRPSLTVEDLHQHCAAHLAAAERPRAIHIDPRPVRT